MKKPSKSEETLGILAHLQKNMPEPMKNPEQPEDELEFPEDEEENEGLDLLKPKPPRRIMSPTQ